MKKFRQILLVAAMLFGCIAQASAETKNIGGWESTNHEDNSTSSHSVEFYGDVLQFNWTVDSESSCDRLIITLDGEEILNCSGLNQSGTYTNENLTQAEHILEFTYTKDGSVTSGTDKATITDIVVLAEETFSLEGLEYKTTGDNTVTLFGCSITEGDLTIPTTITIKEKTYNVTAIGVNTFKNCSSLTSITIPESITRIGNNAFECCDGELFVNCNIPNGGVFSNSYFTKVTINDSIEYIGDYAFYECPLLQEVVLPKKLKHIGQHSIIVFRSPKQPKLFRNNQV